MAGPKPLENADTPSVRICNKKLLVIIALCIIINIIIFTIEKQKQKNIQCKTIIIKP